MRALCGQPLQEKDLHTQELLFCIGQSLLIGFASLPKNTGERSFREPQTLVFESSLSRLFSCSI